MIAQAEYQVSKDSAGLVSIKFEIYKFSTSLLPHIDIGPHTLSVQSLRPQSTAILFVCFSVSLLVYVTGIDLNTYGETTPLWMALHIHLPWNNHPRYPLNIEEQDYAMLLTNGVRECFIDPTSDSDLFVSYMYCHGQSVSTAVRSFSSWHSGSVLALLWWGSKY